MSLSNYAMTNVSEKYFVRGQIFILKTKIKGVDNRYRSPVFDQLNTCISFGLLE